MNLSVYINGVNIHILDLRMLILDFCFQAVTTQMEPKVDFEKSFLNCRNPIVYLPEPGNCFKPVEAWCIKLQAKVTFQILLTSVPDQR